MSKIVSVIILTLGVLNYIDLEFPPSCETLSVNDAKFHSTMA